MYTYDIHIFNNFWIFILNYTIQIFLEIKLGFLYLVGSEHFFRDVDLVSVMLSTFDIW